MVLVIAGDINPQRRWGSSASTTADGRRDTLRRRSCREPPQKKERTAEVSYPGKTLPIINIAYKGDAFDPRTGTTLPRCCSATWRSGNSDLYKKLVIQEQKVQFIAASIPMNRDLPLFEITRW